MALTFKHVVLGSNIVMKQRVCSSKNYMQCVLQTRCRTSHHSSCGPLCSASSGPRSPRFQEFCAYRMGKGRGTQFDTNQDLNQDVKNTQETAAMASRECITQDTPSQHHFPPEDKVVQRPMSPKNNYTTEYTLTTSHCTKVTISHFTTSQESE